VHLVQAKKYADIYDFAKGFLISFGSISLQFKLVFNPKFNSTNNTSGSFNSPNSQIL
jgi:hypothetical protein